MSALALVQPDLLSRCLESALTGLSPESCRVYKARILTWRDWHTQNQTPIALNRENVNRYLKNLELTGSSAQVRNQTLAALKRLASEASDLGWMDPRQAAKVQKLKSRRISGVRTGRWLTLAQSASLMRFPDRTTRRGKRDGGVLALLLGCGLRRAEACALATAQIEWHGETMLIRNIKGKGGRIRSVSVPAWAQSLIQDWRKEVDSAQTDRLLRSIDRSGTIGPSLSPAAVRDIVRHYGAQLGPELANLNPHDLRRTHARLARLGGAPLETIQKTLGHASVKTTEVYVNACDNSNAGDFIAL